MKIPTKHALVIPDTHIPYLDRRAYEIMLAVGQDLNPDEVVILGDYADFYAVNSHGKAADRVHVKLQDEVAAVNEHLDELDGLFPEAKRVFIEGNHCLAEDVEVLTPSGWKGRGALEVGDLVATCPDGSTLEWQPVLEVIDREIGEDEQLYDYSGRCLSIGVTNKHRVYYKSNGSDKFKIAEAENCPMYFDVQTSLKSGLPEFDISDEKLRLAGWLLTDSHFSKTHAGIVLYQRASSAGKVREALSAAKVSYRETERHRAITAVAGRALAARPEPSHEFHIPAAVGQELRKLVSSNETLPDWVYKLSDRQWDVLLEILIEADGSVVSKSGRVFYGKFPICEAVQRAAVTHGWRASLTEYRPNQWRVNLTPRSLQRVENWHASRTDYSGRVWCITVDAGNFLSRRQGTVHLTGNCYRLERYLNTRAPELFGTLTVPQLFKLSQRGWHWVPYGPKQLYQIAGSRLFARHEPLTTGVNHARGTVVKAGCSIIYGHVHTIQSAQVVMANGDQHRGICPGWLGDETHPEFGYVKSHHQWSLGFEVVTILSTGVFFSQTVHIIKCSDGKYRAEWNGTIYEN